MSLQKLEDLGSQPLGSGAPGKIEKPVSLTLEDLERSGHMVRTSEYRLSRLGFEPVYVATEYANEALRRQEHKSN